MKSLDIIKNKRTNRGIYETFFSRPKANSISKPSQRWKPPISNHIIFPTTQSYYVRVFFLSFRVILLRRKSFHFRGSSEVKINDVVMSLLICIFFPNGYLEMTKKVFVRMCQFLSHQNEFFDGLCDQHSGAKRKKFG